MEQDCLLWIEIHTHFGYLAKIMCCAAQQKNAFKNESKLANNNITALALVLKKFEILLELIKSAFSELYQSGKGSACL